MQRAGQAGRRRWIVDTNSVKAAVLALGLSTLQACSLVGNSLNPNSDNVQPQCATYTVNGLAMAEVSHQAAHQCASVGKSARMRRITEAQGQTLAVFDCK
jgi:hypothetical protein